MAGLAGILGNPVLEQLLVYNVVGQVIGAALTPYTQALTNQLNAATPLVPLSPADVAEAQLRNVDVPGGAAHEAALSGVSAERLAVLARLAGNAPDPSSLAVALRRGLIGQDRYTEGIRQGRLRDEWGPLVQELAVVQPPPSAMLAAYLEGQLPEGEARARYAKLGGDPDYFDILFHTEGQAPTPVQAADMANRGIIPWGGSGPDAVSFEQAFLEGPWRNKWEPAFRRSAEYLPPPRTVTAMYREGSLTEAQASKLLEQTGLTPELAAAYLSSSSQVKVEKHRELAVTTVLELYRDGLVQRAQAAALLEKLTYQPAEAEYILQVEDLRATQAAVGHAVTRIRSLYTAHKLDRAAALGAMADLGIDADSASQLVSVWDHERAANVRTLTPADIASGFGHGIITQDVAQAELEQLGYSPHDAWLYLSIHHKSALPGEPGASTLPAGAGP